MRIFLAGLLTVCALVSGCAGRTEEVREGVLYARPERRPLHATLFLPEKAATEPRPCVLLIHGGAWVAGSRHQLRWYGRHLAREGYVAASISYRKLPRADYLDSVHDAKAAVRWLRLHADELGIDPNRIAVLGNSAGGYLAGMLAATAGKPEFEGTDNPGPPSNVAAAVSLYGALDLTQYKKPRTWIRVGGIARRLVGRYVRTSGEEAEDPYLTASPIHYLGKDTAPVLFIHGTDDNWVPYEVSKNAFESLASFGVPTRLYTVPRKGHAFDFFYHAWRKDTFEQILAFLGETLGKTAAK